MAARKATPAKAAAAPVAVPAGRVLAVNVVLRNPESGDVVALYAGNDLPQWAESEVGEHALVNADPAMESESEVGGDAPADEAESE